MAIKKDQCKTSKYQRERERIKREKKRTNSDEVHHPIEKTKQVIKVLDTLGKRRKGKLKIGEFFSGNGNLTKVFKQYGDVSDYDRKKGSGDSYLLIHKQISLKLTYDVLDYDPYGYCMKYFPYTFNLFPDQIGHKGILFITVPRPNKIWSNDMTNKYLENYFGDTNLTPDKFAERMRKWGECEKRKVTMVDCLELPSVWRFAFKVERVNFRKYVGWDK